MACIVKGEKRGRPVAGRENFVARRGDGIYQRGRTVVRSPATSIARSRRRSRR
jgi:hypothetical protein